MYDRLILEKAEEPTVPLLKSLGSNLVRWIKLFSLELIKLITKRILSYFIFGIFSNIVLASSNDQLLFTLSAGPAWYNAAQTQTFYLQPGYENTYVAKKSNQVLASGEWFVGVQRSLGQLGLALYTTSTASLSGQIWETADPLFDNFTYQYKIQHTHVALKGKLLTDLLSDKCLPYVSASAGVGFNLADQFSIKSLLFESIPTSPFTHHTQTAFTYTIGAGLQHTITQQLSLGLGYEFADWGKSTLGRSDGQTLGTGLTLNHLYTNQLQFIFSYFI